MHHASPVRGCSACRMRYRTGSRRLMLGDAMSILARSTRAPSGNSPARMRAKRSRFSLGRPVAPGALAAGLGERAAVLADLVGRQVVDVGLAGPDEVDGPLVELLEVVGGEVQVLAPVEAQPAHVRLDGVDVLLLLLGGVRVVEAQVAAAAELPGDAEVEADRLGVADVEVAVRLRGKRVTIVWTRPSRRSAGDDLTDEVAVLGRGWCRAAHAGEDNTGWGAGPSGAGAGEGDEAGGRTWIRTTDLVLIRDAL